MSKPPEGRNTWADPDFEITLPKPEPSTLLDELIRAFDDGDGAILQKSRATNRAFLVELRRFREAVRCSCCGRCVIGREPVCNDCAPGRLTGKRCQHDR